ncbi:hypothetical protein Y026_5473 [Burkholderia pseudomallei TSV28]|nr:hypothetical protein Y026_5473 [Burkholderia pseudomallei TSV28]
MGRSTPYIAHAFSATMCASSIDSPCDRSETSFAIRRAFRQISKSLASGRTGKLSGACSSRNSRIARAASDTSNIRSATCWSGRANFTALAWPAASAWLSARRYQRAGRRFAAAFASGIPGRKSATSYA